MLKKRFISGLHHNGYSYRVYFFTYVRMLYYIILYYYYYYYYLEYIALYYIMLHIYNVTV